MISNIRLKFGRGLDLSAETIPTKTVTVFVGPNNSGKSKVLSEIEQCCRAGQRNTTSVILEGLTFSGLTPEKAERAIEHIRQPLNPGELVTDGNIIVGGRGGRQQVSLQNLTQYLQDPTANPSA